MLVLSVWLRHAPRGCACTHLSLNVIFAMHWPNSGNSNEFYSSDSHPYGIRVRFMNEIDIFKKRIL